jgi:hypothetical protein
LRAAPGPLAVRRRSAARWLSSSPTGLDVRLRRRCRSAGSTGAWRSTSPATERPVTVPAARSPRCRTDALSRVPRWRRAALIDRAQIVRLVEDLRQNSASPVS